MTPNIFPAELTGVWTARSRLFLTPDSVFESESNMDFTYRSAGQCVDIGYTWHHDGKRHEGVILLIGDRDNKLVRAAWTDSWHVSRSLMNCEGTREPDGAVKVKGYYQVPDNPDWGWIIEIRPGHDLIELRMFNVSPEGEEEIAVEAIYSRK